MGAVLGRDVVYVKLAHLSGHVAAADAAWGRLPGTFFAGYAADDDVERPIAESKAKCEELGEACSGVTCTKDEQFCTARAGHETLESPFAEVSFSKAAVMPPFMSNGVILPSSWVDYHPRVIEEELEQERDYEREMMERGLRRSVLAAASA